MTRRDSAPETARRTRRAKRPSGRQGRGARLLPGAPRAELNQLAVQVTAGTLFVPCHDPRNPKLVLAPAPRLPL